MTGKNRHITILLLIFFLIMPVLSDLKAGEPGTEEKIKKQEEKIESLEQRVKELEGRESAGVKSPFAFNAGLFGDVGFSTRSREKNINRFFLGNMDIYLTANYGDRLTFLSEIVIESEDEGFAVDVERLWIGYAFSDLLTVKAGKQHAALGYWNRAYHHGRQLFLTVDRPFFLAFEDDGGIMPVHVIGVELEGRLSYGPSRFKYEFNVGNNPSIDMAEKKLMPNNNGGGESSSKLMVLRISAVPSTLMDLSVGLSGTVFKVDTTTKAGLEEKIYGVDIQYRRKAFNLMAEYFEFQNTSSRAAAYYIQLSYDATENITPFARFESLDMAEEDPYLSSLKHGFDRRQIIAGLKYDIAAAGIKAQYRYDDARNGRDYHIFELQWSFGF